MDSGRTGDGVLAQSDTISALIQQKDWALTPLGALENWPQSLRTALSICLGSPLPVLIWWGASQVMLYNDAFVPLLGTRHPDALGAAGRDIWADQWQDIEPLVEAALHHGVTSTSSGQPVILEHNGRRDEHYFAFSYSPIYGASGIEGVFTTATEAPQPEPDGAKRPDTRSDAGDTTFDTIFEAIVDAAFVYDRMGKIVRMNSAAHAMYQLDNFPNYETMSPDERAALIAAEDEHGQSLPADKSGLSRLLHGEVLTGANAIDVRLRVADGREIQVNISGAPLIDASGNVTGAVAIARDVTARRQLEREVARRASLLEAVFSAVPGRVTIFDESGAIVQFNPAAQEVAGEERWHAQLDDMVSLFNLRALDGKPFPVEELPVARALRGETVTGVEMVLRDANGSDQTILVSAAPYYDDTGNIHGAVAITHDVTAMRQTERQARWQASMLERAHDVIFMWELGGPIISWNRGAEMLYGFTKEEAYGRISHDLLQTRLPLPRSRFEAMLAREGEWTGELTHTTHDGRQVTVLVRMQVITEPDGRRYVLEASRDITERKALERAVREREARLDAILQLLPVGVAFVDSEGKAVLVNQAVKEIWGENLPLAENFEQFKMFKAWQPQTGQPIAPEAWGLLRTLATGEVSRNTEIDIETLDGKRKTIINSNAPLRDEMDAIVGAVTVMVDITERKRLEQRTSESLDALLTMAEEMVRLPDSGDAAHRSERDGHSGQDSTGTVIRRLLTLTQSILGCHRAAIFVTRRGTDGFYPLEAVGIAVERDHQELASQQEGLRLQDVLPQEMTRKLMAGEIVFVDYSQPPFSERNNPYGARLELIAPMRIGHELVGLLTLDYGAEKHTYTDQERAFAAASAKLAALAVERERLLHEREEARARVIALEETNRRMNDFLGIASHELRTPLTSIQANVQIIDRHLDRLTSSLRAKSAKQASIGQIHGHLTMLSTLTQRTNRQMHRLNRLIGDLLDATRIQAGKLEYHLESCDLVEITRAAVEEQRVAWPGRRIALEVDQLRIPVTCDPDRIDQVVANYLTNALKYSQAEQPVSVQVIRQGDMARVEVRDHGAGLTPEQRAGLFERFYRAPGIVQLSGSGVGLGLGLSICRTIIERHNGHVGVKSTPGKGSTFWFTLPVAAATPTAHG